MAKKRKKSSEDEYLEDYDEDFEEVKPKKKASKKKKKKGNAGRVIAWIVAFAIVLAILLFIRYKYAMPIDETAGEDELPPPVEYEERIVNDDGREYDEAGIYVPPKELGDQVIEREDFEHVSDVVDVTPEPELFSNLECNYDYDMGVNYISLRVYNVLGEDIKISPRGVEKGYNTYFLVRGMVDMDPGCGTELLLPGEWTECNKIGLDQSRYGNSPGTNRISVQVPGKTEALVLECPELPETVDEE